MPVLWRAYQTESENGGTIKWVVMSDSNPRTPGVPRILYTVAASHPDGDSARRYIAWLNGGHTAAVIRGGATRATVAQVRSEPTPLVQVRYEFPSREVFDRYVREFAPALRAEGLALFGPGSGVEFARTVEEIAEHFPGASA